MMKGYKTQMGTTLESCSHFVTCESLHSMTPGYGYLGWLHFHLFRACAFHRFLLQPIAFRTCLLRLCLPAVPRFSFRSTFPDGASLRLQSSSSLASISFLHRTSQTFRQFCSPVYFRNSRFLLFPVFNSTF